MEIARLKALGFGRQARAGGGGGRPRQPRQPRQPPAEGDAARPRKRQATATATATATAGSGSDASASSGSESDEDESESESEDEGDDGIDVDELLQKDEDVYEVEKLTEWREVVGGGREFLVKWKGYSSKETTCGSRRPTSSRRG